LEALNLVSAEKVKRKLPSLIAGNCSSRNKKSWNAYKRYLYKFSQFKKRNPEKFNTLTNKVIVDLTELDKAVNQ